jgi:hypothetical protein
MSILKMKFLHLSFWRGEQISDTYGLHHVTFNLQFAARISQNIT